MLIAVGVLMWVAESAGAASMRDLGDVDLPDAAAIGLAQALAVVPGTSRSGITITAGLFRNLDRESAARFSFLLSTPAIGGGGRQGALRPDKQGGIHGLLTTDFRRRRGGQRASPAAS